MDDILHLVLHVLDLDAGGGDLVALPHLLVLEHLLELPEEVAVLLGVDVALRQVVELLPVLEVLLPQPQHLRLGVGARDHLRLGRRGRLGLQQAGLPRELLPVQRVDVGEGVEHQVQQARQERVDLLEGFGQELQPRQAQIAFDL